MSLKNKRILITAGPTWVPIDSVRVISNIATGKTGILLADKLQHRGAEVTLLLGPAEAGCCLSKKIRLIRFKFFDELKELIKDELKARQYDIVIHSAAVSDYRPSITQNKKIKSGKKSWGIKLIPTVKIIDALKRLDSSLFTVGFKFEPAARPQFLLASAKRMLERANLDVAVANSIHNGRYKAYILDSNKIYGPYLNKGYLAERLIHIMGES